MFPAKKLRSFLVVSFVLVFGIMLSFGGSASAIDGGWKAGYGKTVEGTGGLSSQPISVIILVMMRWLLYLVGFLAVIAFVISGILYLTSAGDDERIERAKTTMIYAIVGVIVALLGLIIINAVQTWLGGQSAQF